jgi:hypothetical protein
MAVYRQLVVSKLKPKPHIALLEILHLWYSMLKKTPLQASFLDVGKEILYKLLDFPWQVSTKFRLLIIVRTNAISGI